jgi:hypothetical protein
VLASRVDDHKVGPEALPVESHMGFGRGLAPPVLGPSPGNWPPTPAPSGPRREWAS